MRIALVHPYSWPNTRRGGERYLHDLAWYLRGAGHDVTIFSGHGGADLPGTEFIEGVEVRRSWARAGPRLRRLPTGLADRVVQGRVARALEGEFDAVHALWPTAARAATARYPTVYTLLGMPTLATSRANPSHLRSLRAAAQAADVAAALSAAVKEEVEHLVPARWTVLPPGIRMSRFPLSPTPEGPPSLLFSASLSTRYKGLPTALRAFALIREQQPDVELILSGSGSHEWAMDELTTVQRRVVEPALRVVGTGTLADAEALYARASVMVLPATNEAFGLSVVEALATGCPVVVADHGGPADIIGEAQVGARVPVGDVEALAVAVQDWMTRAQDRSVRARCREEAARYDWETVVGPLHERVYAALRSGERELPSA